MPDKEIVCRDCDTPFVFTEGEQQYFQERGLQDPKRCKACRQKKKAENNDASSTPRPAAMTSSHDDGGSRGRRKDEW